MVERNTGPTPPVRLPHGIGRHPDGDTVPHKPRPTRPPLTLEQMLPGLTVAAVVLVLLVLGLLRTAGVLS